MKYCLIAFENTHAAMTTEKHLKDLVKISIMPTLREISMGCGISVKFACEDLEKVIEAMKLFPLDKSLYKIYDVSSDGPKMAVSVIY